MRASEVVLVLLGLSLMITGCASSRAEREYEDHLRVCLANNGLHADSGGVRWWTDPSGRTVFVVGKKCNDASPTHWDYSLVLLKDDRQQPTIVDLREIDLTKQWVDSGGRVWSLPAFVTEEEKARINVNSIDESSGLFVAFDSTHPNHPFSVGRMDHSQGWLFTDTLPADVSYGVHVRAKGPNVIVSENWSFKVSGVQGPRPHHWVYSPDPDNPGRYVRTDSYW